MRGGLTKGERTLREDWPVVDSSWRRAGVEELPCELVREQRFLGSGVPVKQLRSWRKGMGVERKRERDWDGVEKVGRTSPNCQAGRGKMAQPRLWAKRGFYRRGWLRKLVQVQ
jgi:hypothetical protein